MVRVRADRSLATVLFVDIVDSTRIASDAGDRRWRELLGLFRHAVRRQLKRHGGREQDTAGDGFFATFERPVGAVRAAAAVVDATQQLGVDVRCGLHTGELEHIDGRLGGIAAHIGARVMALAGPSEVLMTATVHDLVVGGDVLSEEVERAVLRGIPGSWIIYRLAAVDGAVLPSALDAELAIDRIAAGSSMPRASVRRFHSAIALAVIGAVGLAGLWSGALALLPADSSREPAVSPASRGPPTMIKIDATTNEITAMVYDQYLPLGRDGRALIVDGTLWHETPINVVRRDIHTGAVIDVIDKPANTEVFQTWFSFGSVWFGVPAPDRQVHALHRLNPLSGRTLAEIVVDRPIRGVAFGRDAIFFLTRDAEVVEIDPESNEIADIDTVPLETIPDAIVAVGPNVWICECDEGRIVQFDPERDEVVRRVEFAQRGFILDDRRELSQGNLSQDQETVWLMDGDAGTITPIDAGDGTAGQPIGIPQGSFWHDFGDGTIWISAWTDVYRLDLATGQGERIPLPDGVYAGGIAVDELTGAVWLANFVPPSP